MLLLRTAAAASTMVREDHATGLKGIPWRGESFGVFIEGL